MEMMTLKEPVISVLMEKAQRRSLAIAAGDRLAMLSNAIYTVISPRDLHPCSEKDPAREAEAADTARIPATDLLRFGLRRSDPDGGRRAQDPDRWQDRIRSYC
jgi:acetyl-CoA carboxylase carboxyl transferase subunit alpha